MKAKVLRKAGLLVLSISLLMAVGCGGSKKAEAPETEALELAAVTEAGSEAEVTEAIEEMTEAIEAATEELLAEVPESAGGKAEEETESKIMDMSAVKYAKQTVNVRKEPSAEAKKLGSLSANQKVTITGQAEDGWYRIVYQGAEGYVSGKYLVDEKGTAGNRASKADTGSGNTDKTNVDVSADTSADNTPVVDNIPVTDNTPVTDNAPVDNTPSVPQTPSEASTPAVDNTPVAEETPEVDNTPAVEETPEVNNPYADDPNNLGSVGGAGTWETWGDSSIGSVVVWE